MVVAIVARVLAELPFAPFQVENEGLEPPQPATVMVANVSARQSVQRVTLPILATCGNTERRSTVVRRKGFC
jgi:hypothetical protein